MKSPGCVRCTASSLPAVTLCRTSVDVARHATPLSKTRCTDKQHALPNHPPFSPVMPTAAPLFPLFQATTRLWISGKLRQLGLRSSPVSLPLQISLTFFTEQFTLNLNQWVSLDSVKIRGISVTTAPLKESEVLYWLKFWEFSPNLRLSLIRILECV